MGTGASDPVAADDRVALASSTAWIVPVYVHEKAILWGAGMGVFFGRLVGRFIGGALRCLEFEALVDNGLDEKVETIVDAGTGGVGIEWGF